MLRDDQNIEKSGPSAYVGLIPAAGFGSRLPDKRVAKEMLAVGVDGKPAIGHLLHVMHGAGVRDVAIVLRPEKRALTDYLEHEDWHHMRIHLRFTSATSGVPQTVALGLEDIERRNIVFGFPDILFEPKQAFSAMMQRLEAGNAQVVLGLFPTASPEKSDMVKTDRDGRVIDIEIKPDTTRLDLTWRLAVWKPAFSNFLIRLLQCDSRGVGSLAANSDDNHLGQVFMAAISDGMPIDSVSFSQGRSLDIGTPDDLALAQSWAG